MYSDHALCIGVVPGDRFEPDGTGHRRAQSPAPHRPLSDEGGLACGAGAGLGVEEGGQFGGLAHPAPHPPLALSQLGGVPLEAEAQFGLHPLRGLLQPHPVHVDDAADGLGGRRAHGSAWPSPGAPLCGVCERKHGRFRDHSRDVHSHRGIPETPFTQNTHLSQK